MQHYKKKTLAVLLAAAVLSTVSLFSGCGNSTKENSGNKLTNISIPTGSTGSSTAGSTSPSAVSTPTTENTNSEEESSPADYSEPAQIADPTNSQVSSAPNIDVTYRDPLEVPSSANIRIRSLSEALANFSEIESKTPEGSPEEIVKTLLERNILCFATLQVKCWSFDPQYSENYEYMNGTAPVHSDYLKSTQQIDDLFYGTYINSKAEYLIHYEGWTNAFTESNGSLYFSFSDVLKSANDSFETPTYAAVISASDNEIVFGRYYEQNPTAGSPEPNNFHFKAVKVNGAWRLENYITDAPAYKQPYSNLIQTGRIGAPDIVKIASQEVGNFGGEPYWSWYGFNYRIEWCAAFVSWCYYKAGQNGPYFVACNSEGIYWFKQVGQWAGPDYRDIAPGDSIFFDWDLDGSANHVGLVIGTDGEKVYTIEGNRSDACRTFAYDLDDPCIFGYGLMNWD